MIIAEKKENKGASLQAIASAKILFRANLITKAYNKKCTTGIQK